VAQVGSGFVAATVHIGDGHTSVHAHGEFDIATATVLADALEEACSHGQDVAIDMAAVTFIDAYALHPIVEAAKTCHEAGHRLTMTHPSATVARVIRLSGLNWLIHGDAYPLGSREE
jgi:anti-anti-sigma factor